MGKKRSSTADAAPSTPDNVRLHITPLTAETASSILPAGTDLSSISYHTLPTFPDAPFAFVNLPVEAADKLKKKLKNAMFRGVKVRVEDARPETWKELVRETEEERRERKRVKREKKEKKKQGLLEGVQLPDERRVARGWVEGTDKELKKDKRGECLFKAAIPANKTDLIKEKPKKEKTKEEQAAEKAKEKEEKKENKEKKKQRKDEKKRIVKEFENLQKFPSFLKTSQLDPTRGPEDLVGEYNEEVGWTDRKGTVVEEPVKKKKSKKEKKEKEEAKVEVKETIPEPVKLPEIKKTKKGEAVVVFDDDEMEVDKAEESFNDIPENKGWAVQSSKAKQVYNSDTESEDEAVAEEQAEAEEKQKVAEEEEEEKEEEAENDKEEEDEAEKDEEEGEEEEEDKDEEEEEEEEEEAAEDAMDVDVPTPKQPTEPEAKVEPEVVAEDKDESEDESEAENEASDSESESDDDEEETADAPETKESPITKAPSPPAVVAPVEVHPLEALYKPTALTISTDVASESAGGFKFGFGGGNDSDDDDEATTSTPYKDPSRYRSSAPTPDTAIGNKRFFSPTASTGSSEDEEPAPTPRAPFSHPPGTDAPLLFLHEDSRFLKGLSVWNQLPTPKALQPKEDEDIVDPAELWKKRFYEQRGEWNREWKRRRREGMKAKRKREARNGPGASGANRV